MFSIGFTDEPLEYPDDDTSIPAAPGRLLLGKSIEEFLANLSEWDKSDYEAHWMRELKVLLEGNPKVALVVSYYGNPASNMQIWRAYRDGEWVHFQNQILWYSNLPPGFELSKLSQYIPDRAVMTPEGNRISEWDVPIRDIESFLRGKSGTRQFSVGDRVIVDPDFYWAQGAAGTVAEPPPEVLGISGPWNGLTRTQETAIGTETVYWVWFDEPQRDNDGGGPFRGGAIDGNALTLLPKDSN